MNLLILLILNNYFTALFPGEMFLSKRLAWSSSESGEIARAQMSGGKITQQTTVITDDLYSVHTLSVYAQENAEEERLFWINGHRGLDMSIESADLATFKDRRKHFAREKHPDLMVSVPTGLVVDAGRVYWGEPRRGYLMAGDLESDAVARPVRRDVFGVQDIALVERGNDTEGLCAAAGCHQLCMPKTTETQTPAVECVCADGYEGSDCKAVEGWSEPSFSCEGLGLPCRNGVGCFRLWSTCDGSADCADGSDEAGCPAREANCTAGLRCRHSDACLPLEWRCDGEIDCEDGRLF